MSLAKLHRTMPTTIWIYPTCCHTFGKSPTNVKDFQKIPTNSKRFHYNLENSNFPGGQSLLGDFSYFYNTWQTECLHCFYRTYKCLFRNGFDKYNDKFQKLL